MGKKARDDSYKHKGVAILIELKHLREEKNHQGSVASDIKKLAEKYSYKFNTLKALWEKNSKVNISDLKHDERATLTYVEERTLVSIVLGYGAQNIKLDFSRVQAVVKEMFQKEVSSTWCDRFVKRNSIFLKASNKTGNQESFIRTHHNGN